MSEKFGEHHLCMLPQLGVSNKPERWRKEREAYLAVTRQGTNNNISDMRSKDVTGPAIRPSASLTFSNANCLILLF